MSPAGTIRACRRSPACAGAACRRRRCANSSARIGVAKANSIVDIAMFEHAIREVLNRTALRRMAVLRPLKVVIENYPEGEAEELEAVNHPEDPAAGTRRMRFGRELYVERDDFMENPPKKFFRLSPGREVRLRYAYFITCREVVKNAAGEVVELICTYDPATRGGNAPDGRKVQATMHWVGAPMRCRPRCGSTIRCSPSPTPTPRISRPISIRSRSRCCPTPGSSRRWPAAIPMPPVQFERQGYFIRDPTARPGAWCSTAPSACATPG